jgi:hypothetical protein
MTDRHIAYVVTLADDVREDDAEAGILTALRMIRGVADVRPVIADRVVQQSTRARVSEEWRAAMIAAVLNQAGRRS